MRLGPSPPVLLASTQLRPKNFLGRGPPGNLIRVNTILFVATWLTLTFCVGVLVGSGLHTMSIDRRYWRLARLVHHLNELNAARDGNPAEHAPHFVNVR